MVKNNLLIEIGTEEMPSSYLETAAHQFFDKVSDLLSSHNVPSGKGKYFYTPRRIGVIFNTVSLMSGNKVVEYKGPPYNLAFKDGKPTVQGMGFAKSKGVDIKNLFTKGTEKGEFVFAKVKIKGDKSVNILKKGIPEIILSLEFPKTMKWDSNGIRFARPIRWVVAILGNQVIKFRLGSITSGRYTYGHRFLAPNRTKLRNTDEYKDIMEKGFVIFDPAERRKIIEKKLNNYAESIGAEIVEDEILLQDVTNLVEFPEVILGKFDKKYLILPDDVIITAMRVHQRYFALRKNKKLLNQFLAVINIQKNKKIVQGNENVLKARLEDALFYWTTDKKMKLKERVNELKKIAWQEGAGTMYDKTLRISQLSQSLCSLINGCRKTLVKQVAELSKTDLTTHMIRDGKEFTGLEGIVGMEYGISEGIDKEIAMGIFENRLPRFPGDKLPSRVEYIVVSVCDKIDTITTAFLLDKIPSGSKDPLGIRRVGNAVIETLMDKDIHFSMKSLVKETVKLSNGDTNIQREIIDFISRRAKAYLLNKDIRYDIADAVINEGIDDIRDVYLKADAISRMRLDSRDFTNLVIRQKRVANILKDIKTFTDIREYLFEEKAERDLYKYLNKNSEVFKKQIEERRYASALKILLEMRKYIDAFFDKVLVMTDSRKLRENRLSLLHNLREMFLKIADFSLIVIEGNEKIIR